MTARYELDDELAAYWTRCCDGKLPLGARVARRIAEEERSKGGTSMEAYRCPFAHLHNHGPEWHVGQPMSVPEMFNVASLLRARSGNAPAAPGSGRRESRRDRRKHR